MKTVAVYPALSPHDTQDLMPKNPGLEDLFPKANLGKYEVFHLRNLHLMNDWEHTRAYEGQRGCLYGHKETERVIHKANITAKRNEQCKSNWGEHQLQSSTSDENCKFLRKDLYPFLKHTCSPKGNVESPEGNPVSPMNTDSNNIQYSLRLNNHSSMSEHRKFKNEGENSQYNQFEGSVSRGSLFFHQQLFSPHAKVCNVDNNGGDIIQPSLLNTSHGMVNMEELLMYNKMSQPLSKSSNPNHCKSIYDGVRGYSGNKTGYKVEGH
ncbi:hypothetical protein MJG53_013230 [Ovis ammon polii x Ovis aries]|uniref:Uncharacterized protein n=1 Tax=Ovis ammon polii x Ovis aries TaxID=2918886 RepID=A0ACB9UIB5_9CETA|nr:hypothetical protein MJG53_013230 [Ovis ammon polii x Ovis aries]